MHYQMKNKQWISGFLVLIFIVFAQTPVQANFLSGNDLIPFMKEWDKKDSGVTTGLNYSSIGTYYGFIIGVYDTISNTDVCNKITKAPRWGLPDGTTSMQLVAVVSKYLKSHPEKWSDPATVLVINALTEAFPCPCSDKTPPWHCLQCY
jgi:hypothetical protein